MIDRPKFPRQMIGLVVGGGTRRTKADMPRRRRQRTENRHRIHARGILIAMAYSDFLVVAISVGDREAICEKDEIELPLLELARNLDVILRRQERHLVGGISPERVAMRHRTCDQEAGEIHVTG